jgi:flagellar motility protein MotE (MotC chaperone)
MAKGKKKEEAPPAEEPVEAPEAGGEGTESKPAAKSGPSPIILTVSALVAFVVFLGIFSFTMGVFDKKPAVDPATAEHAADSTKPQPATAEHAEQDAPAFADDEEGKIEFNFAQEAPDTLAEISWIELEKKKILSDKMAIAIERKQLESLRREVENLLAKKDLIKGERVAYLAKLFDGMKQDEVGKLMEQLDDNTIVAVLPKMKTASASRVLAMLPATRAARITTILLGLNE